jgi:triosephosphate isomerase
MLISCNIEWTILGHSERRNLFQESNEVVREKVKRAMTSNLGVILCVGEQKEVRNRGEEEAYVEQQLMDSMPKELPEAYWPRLVLAYEPVWAIGTGLTASPEQAQSMHAFIRNRMESSYVTKAGRVPILYGGSMKPANASELLGQKDIDGGLIGGASLKADSFIDIIRQAELIEKN